MSRPSYVPASFAGHCKVFPERDVLLLPYQARWVTDDSRLKAMEKGRQIGMSWASAYTPETGFRGDEDLDIPPAARGTLRDLSSRARIDLVLITNMRQCANYGFWKQGQTDFARWAFPCYELVRI